MQFTKEQRRKAMTMAEDRCSAFHNYIKCHESYRNLLKQAILDNHDSDNPLAGIDDIVINIEEMIRDMRILIRKQELVQSLTCKQEMDLKIDILLRDFFQSRMSYDEKWRKTEAGIKVIVEFLQSSNE